MKLNNLIVKLPGTLFPEVVAADRVLSMGKKRTAWHLNWELWHLNWEQTNELCKAELLEIELFDHLTECKQMIDA